MPQENYLWVMVAEVEETETFMVYNKYWDGKLMDYYKQAQAVRAKV